MFVNVNMYIYWTKKDAPPVFKCIYTQIWKSGLNQIYMSWKSILLQLYVKKKKVGEGLSKSSEIVVKMRKGSLIKIPNWYRRDHLQHEGLRGIAGAKNG